MPPSASRCHAKFRAVAIYAVEYRQDRPAFRQGRDDAASQRSALGRRCAFSLESFRMRAFIEVELAVLNSWLHDNGMKRIMTPRRDDGHELTRQRLDSDDERARWAI